MPALVDMPRTGERKKSAPDGKSAPVARQHQGTLGIGRSKLGTPDIVPEVSSSMPIRRTNIGLPRGYKQLIRSIQFHSTCLYSSQETRR